jgi:hypothetical protein
MLNAACLAAETPMVVPEVNLPISNDAAEVTRLIAGALKLPQKRRVEFISKYLIGRKYRPETKKRIAGQHAKKVEKKEATNSEPLPLAFLPTSMTWLDCMTYVEHVLAMASCSRPAYENEFLCRLIDIMFDAGGKPLMNHHRNHFTSHWGDVNERKGYLANIARHHPLAVSRGLFLNRVGSNRTYYIEDRFMTATRPQLMWYFTTQTVVEGKAPLRSGDIVAMVTDKEGLDVTHMGFYIEHSGQKLLRHASSKLNRVTEQDLVGYLQAARQVKGLMVFRPLLRAAVPPAYRFKGFHREN